MGENKLNTANKVAKKLKEAIDDYWKGKITGLEA